MAKHRDIDAEHERFREQLKAKHERAEKLRSLFEKGKQLFSKDKNSITKISENKPSAFVEQQRAKHTTSLPVYPTPTPPNSYTAMKRKESMNHQWINHRSFERSLIEQKR